MVESEGRSIANLKSWLVLASVLGHMVAFGDCMGGFPHGTTGKGMSTQCHQQRFIKIVKAISGSACERILA